MGFPSINSGDVDHLSLDMSDEPYFSICCPSNEKNKKIQRPFLCQGIDDARYRGKNAQFEKIEKVRSECISLGIPIFSIDTKKKKMIGNFKRQGKVSCKGQQKSYNRDIQSFADGVIVPHGIYDVGTNTAYMTLGTATIQPNSSVTISLACGRITSNGNPPTRKPSAYHAMEEAQMPVRIML